MLFLLQISGSSPCPRVPASPPVVQLREDALAGCSTIKPSLESRFAVQILSGAARREGNTNQRRSGVQRLRKGRGEKEITPKTQPRMATVPPAQRDSSRAARGARGLDLQPIPPHQGTVHAGACGSCFFAGAPGGSQGWRARAEGWEPVWGDPASPLAGRLGGRLRAARPFGPAEPPSPRVTWVKPVPGAAGQGGSGGRGARRHGGDAGAAPGGHVGAGGGRGGLGQGRPCPAGAAGWRWGELGLARPEARRGGVRGRPGADRRCLPPQHEEPGRGGRLVHRLAGAQPGL